MRTSLLVALSSSLVLTACLGSPDDSSSVSDPGSVGQGKPSPGSALPCDVDAILAKHCRSCHGASPKFGAPMPLVTLADLTAKAISDPSKKVYELVAQRIRDDARPMPPPPGERLGDADASVIERWASSGAPAGSAACTGGGGGGEGTTLSCTPDVELKPSAPYVIGKDDRDAYVCYGVDVPVQKKRHITAFAPRVDNSAIVHHILLVQTDHAVSPVPAPCAAAGANAAMGRLVGVWAPGGDALELPPEAGFPLEGTAHFMVQVHYSNLRGLDNQRDTSGYSFCTTSELRPNDADIAAFGTLKINIPEHSTQDQTCVFDIPSFVTERTALWGMPHMHKLGKLISSSVLPGRTGAPVDLGTAAPWNFDNQTWHPLQAKIKGGDRVVTRCSWANPGASPVTFGETTEKEMCFSFVMYYPRIESPLWSWALPATVSQCSPTAMP